MLDKKPIVSIIIPFYKNAHWLSQTIQSAVNLTYANKEIIIINDASNEPIDYIINHYSNFVDLKYFKHEQNRGVSAARNTGISQSFGEYILPLDSDDVINCNDWIEQCLSLIDEKTIVTTPYNYCDLNMNSINKIWPTQKLPFSEAPNQGIMTNSSMYHKNLWVELNGYDENLKVYEDGDFWLGAYFKGYKLKYLDNPCINYRVNPNGLSHASIKEKEIAWNHMRKKHNMSKTFEEIMDVKY